MSEKKKILYVQRSVDTPEHTYAPFVLAAAAETKIVGAATLNNLVLDADAVLSF